MNLKSSRGKAKWKASIAVKTSHAKIISIVNKFRQFTFSLSRGFQFQFLRKKKSSRGWDNLHWQITHLDQTAPEFKYWRILISAFWKIFLQTKMIFLAVPLSVLPLQVPFFPHPPEWKLNFFLSLPIFWLFRLRIISLSLGTVAIFNVLPSQIAKSKFPTARKKLLWIFNSLLLFPCSLKCEKTIHDTRKVEKWNLWFKHIL